MPKAVKVKKNKLSDKNYSLSSSFNNIPDGRSFLPEYFFTNELTSKENILITLLRWILLLAVGALAYSFRLNAVRVYGRVIHEFDPWFNFRATQYLVDNGIVKFFNWFDEMSWYPIGRHVGSTIYPGLMVTSAVIHWALNFFTKMSLNDVCVFVPAWFGALNCWFTYGLTKEVSGYPNAGLIAAAIMAVLPAHLMRTIAGGYDNESIAITAMICTFYLWVRSLRTSKSWPIGFLTALSYIYMVAAWGGYSFVLNMIGAHAGFLLIVGKFDINLHRAYTIFYTIGTLGAIQFPLVGWMPMTSLEQLMPLAVFLGMQAFYLIEVLKEKYELNRLRVYVFGATGLVWSLYIAFLLSIGELGSLSSRVRSLFIAHTRTGNPLVDSVAEHQATPPQFYWQYFHVIIYFTMPGFVMLFVNRTSSKYFGILYVAFTYYFSQKMVRLILLLAPAASMASGVFIWILLQWAFTQLTTGFPKSNTETEEKGKGPKKTSEDSNIVSNVFFKIIAIAMLLVLISAFSQYYFHSEMLAEHISEPQIILRSRKQDGSYILVDDFRLAYWWLRDHTPADARVMAWWDYGYQINGIANRTTIADGNTWNHEHIALLGKCLVSKEEDAWKIARHLADYVLVWSTRWAGLIGDDAAKMPHMANIAGSVFPDINQRGYWIDRNNNASPLAKESLLYRLIFNGMVQGLEPLKYYEEVYSTPYRMVRIYKIKDVAPRPPKGKYPPHLLNKQGKIGQFRDVKH